jgi:hypothetical protein
MIAVKNTIPAWHRQTGKTALSGCQDRDGAAGAFPIRRPSMKTHSLKTAMI